MAPRPLTQDSVTGRIVAQPVAAPSPSAVPTFVGSGSSFAVGADTQALWSADIDVQGELAIDGTMVEVA